MDTPARAPDRPPRWLPAVATAMLVLTAASAATLVMPGSLWSHGVNAWFVLAVATLKAALVGWFFMHLKDERRWKWFLCVPPLVLAGVLVAVLIPDVAMGPLHDRLPSWNVTADNVTADNVTADNVTADNSTADNSTADNSTVGEVTVGEVTEGSVAGRE